MHLKGCHSGRELCCGGGSFEGAACQVLLCWGKGDQRGAEVETSIKNVCTCYLLLPLHKLSDGQ